VAGAVKMFKSVQTIPGTAIGDRESAIGSEDR